MKQISDGANHHHIRLQSLCSIVLMAVLLAAKPAAAQQETDVIKKWIGFSDAPNALYHHIAAGAYALLDKRSAAMTAIHTLSGWQQQQQTMRATLLDMVGPFPEKTSLHARVTGTIQKNDYSVENLVYESQPGYYVTAALFLPRRAKNAGKAPAIIYCSGHSESGYRDVIYQHVILNLVKKGFVVLAFDPVGQGERLGYYDPATGKSRHKWPSEEHAYPGAQVFISGASLARYMIWDGIRAVDYLLSRKEVDPARIGITGRSGGGTQSAYIAAFDERIKAAAPENYITSFKRLFESIGPQDAEQNFFHALQRGMDMGDLLLVRAPRPTLMITTTRDMFPIQGAMETAKEVAGIYKAYGKADDFSMVTDDAPHASTKKNREAMYAFFQQHLNNPGSAADEATTALDKKELQVTATGQIATSLKGETVFSLNKKQVEAQEGSLNAARLTLSAHLPAVITAAKKLSGYHEPQGTPEPVFTGRLQRPGYVVEKMFVKGEGNYVIPYLLMKPDTPNHKALLYLDPAGKSEKAVAGGEMEWWVKNGFTVLLPDLIGTGEMGPGVFKGDSYIDGNSYNIWFAAMLTGRSITGIRAGDVIRLTRLLQHSGNIQQIYGLAKGTMSPVLLHAAAFDTAITGVGLIAPYVSYHNLAVSQLYRPEFIESAVPGAMGAYDLPDLAAGIAPRKLMLTGITDGNGNQLEPAALANETAVIKAAYQYRQASGELLILPADTGEAIRDDYRQWLHATDFKIN